MDCRGVVLCSARGLSRVAIPWPLGSKSVELSKGARAPRDLPWGARPGPSQPHQPRPYDGLAGVGGPEPVGDWPPLEPWLPVDPGPAP